MEKMAKQTAAENALKEAEDSSETDANEAVGIILKKEVDLITESFLLEHFTSSELEELQLQLSLETQSVLRDSAQLIAEENKSVSMKRKAVSHRIKVFLVKCFSRIFTVNLLEVGRMAYSDWLTLKEGRKEVLQSLLDTVNSLFETEERDAPAGGFPKLDTVLRDKDLAFVRKFNQMSNSYVTGDCRVPSGPYNKAKALVSSVNWWLQTQADFHVDRVNVRLTKVLIKEGATLTPSTPRRKRRKLSIQQQKLLYGHRRKLRSGNQRKRLRASLESALLMAEGDTPTHIKAHSAPKESPQLGPDRAAQAAPKKDAPPGGALTALKKDTDELSVASAQSQSATLAQMEMRKNIRVLVKSIVSRTSKKLKFGSAVSDPQVTKWLFNKVWSEVKDIECQITPEMLKKLENSVVKHLCKKWGDAMTVLHLMDLEDSAINKYIASSYLDSAKSPRKRNAIYRFFFALRNAYRGRKRTTGP